jgi:peptidoglycan/LPS O-acetylase OafA/YrhL
MSSTKWFRKLPARGDVRRVQRLALQMPQVSTDDSGTESTMDDPRDFLAIAWYGNLGVLLLGIGLLGVLIHRKTIRQWLCACVGLLGILFLSEGGALFHGATVSLRGSIVGALIAALGCFAVMRSLKSTGGTTRNSS